MVGSKFVGLGPDEWPGGKKEGAVLIVVVVPSGERTTDQEVGAGSGCMGAQD